VLPVLSNPLFSPVEVKEGCSPLRACVLSLSQFTGAERESLVELAKHLGARYGPLYLWTPVALADCSFGPL